MPFALATDIQCDNPANNILIGRKYATGFFPLPCDTTRTKVPGNNNIDVINSVSPEERTIEKHDLTDQIFVVL